MGNVTCRTRASERYSFPIGTRGRRSASSPNSPARNFDCHPRVWGDSKRPVDRIAFLNGSWGDPDLYERCVAAGIDCVIVGETRYHLCVDAQPYLSIIELGHDRSELPIVDVLIDALLACDVSRDDILDLRGMHRNWWTA